MEEAAKRYLNNKDAKALAAELKTGILANPTAVSAALKIILPSLETISNKDMLQLGDELNAAGILSSHKVEEQTYPILKEIFNIYIARQDYMNATNFLSKAPLLKEEFGIPKEERFQMILNLITAYLENKQSISCEALLMEAHKLATKIKNNDLLIQYNYCCGQYYNLTRKFLLSGMRYYAACNIESANMTPDSISDMLSKVIDATILAPTGSKKSFLVANLIKDERAKTFKNFQLLQKISREVLINKEEIDAFCSGLSSHQNIMEKDGFTNVEKVFLEHNILVIAKFYRDIKIESLAQKLKIKRSQLETILQNMKNEEKMDLAIDHLTGFITLKNDRQILHSSNEALGNFCGLLERYQVPPPSAAK